jgi:chromate transporter
MHPAFEVFLVFLRLGLTSFGGPVAHLGYFRRALVEKRDWLTEPDYASLVALCQVLPGPASSQTGFGIGLLRAGWQGGLAAWAGFTLPSAVLMFALASSATALNASHLGAGLLHGLQLAAVAVVAQAVCAMALNLCPDTPRRFVAAVSVLLLFLLPGSIGQIVVIILGGMIGRFVLAPPSALAQPTAAPRLGRAGAGIALGLFTFLLAESFVRGGGNLALFNAFYHSGALVFGGGHVVLPLLHAAIVRPGWVSPPLFLAGYGAAQAMPGPLFTFAAYLGALSSMGSGGWVGALFALIGIFLPGLLLTAGILPFWHGLRRHDGLAAALNGVNAAVVGLLVFALLNLLTNGTIRNPVDTLVAVTALAMLTIGKVRPLPVVAICAAAGMLFSKSGLLG